MRAHTLADFDFDLPNELIAQHPTAQRSGSRFLDGTGEVPVDRAFTDLPQLLKRGDLLVFNDTRVIKARLLGKKTTGGAVEALVERVLPGAEAGVFEVWAHMRASKSPRIGTWARFADSFDAEVLGRVGPDGSLFHLRFPQAPLELLERYGHVPLPPYITHEDSAEDERRYQTVFARQAGSVAAPTAALHFDEAVLASLALRGLNTAAITLHVGAGTFLPVRVNEIAHHRMHSERFEVSQATVDAIRATRATGGCIVVVGTTTLRALESAARQASADEVIAPYQGDTDIFITPGFEFRVVDNLITNFHLPRSTLMMLVSAFAGHGQIMALYRHAVAQRYRFFSYGDSMLLGRK
jgi:S-adenosylmethionine:tRNA ribosyltransferase-isomerase